MPKVVFENGKEIDASELFTDYMKYLTNRGKFILPVHLIFYNEFLNQYFNNVLETTIMFCNKKKKTDNSK
jgi:hypothetical protein